MQPILVVVFMIIIGAVIGGVTNMIAVKMLFHPFRAYYIFGKRIPFTPGLIPKRRGEIAEKIGQVIEDHLLTEALIQEKLATPEIKETMNQTVKDQIHLLEQDHVTLQRLAERFDIDIVSSGERQLKRIVYKSLNEKYLSHQNQGMNQWLPDKILQQLDKKVDSLDEFLLTKARDYLESEKGYHDITDMLETFFVEKGKIVGLLQMFMTQEAIAERIQKELIRLTYHPKAKNILAQQLKIEYERIKVLPLKEIIQPEAMEQIQIQLADYVLKQANITKRAHQPLNTLAPELFEMLHEKGAERITDMIIDTLSRRLSQIMKKVNIRGLIEEQINRFDLDYIEQLIFEIANKELKLIMLLGFILGGIIGFFQGLIAIFV